MKSNGVIARGRGKYPFFHFSIFDKTYFCDKARFLIFLHMSWAMCSGAKTKNNHTVRILKLLLYESNLIIESV
jgi:hypothetical protein